MSDYSEDEFSLLPVGKLTYDPDHFVVNIDMSRKEFDLKLKEFCKLRDYNLKEGVYGDLHGYVLIFGEDPVAWVTIRVTVVSTDSDKYNTYTYSKEHFKRMLEVRAATDGKEGSMLATFFRKILELFFVGKDVADDSFFVGLTSRLYWKNLSPPQDTDYSEFAPPFVKWNERLIELNKSGKLGKPKNVGGKPRYKADEWAREEVIKGKRKKEIRNQWQVRRKKEMEAKYRGEPADWDDTFRKVFSLSPENRKIPEDT